MSKNTIHAAGTQEQRIEHWIAQLEEQARLLLSDIDIEEINHKERLNLALKMMSQIQHFLAMQQKTAVSPPGNNHVNIMLENLMRQMRGEDNHQPPELPIAFADNLEDSPEDNPDEDWDEESDVW